MEMHQKQKLLVEEANRMEELSKKRYAQLEKLFAQEHKSKIYFRNKYYASEKRLQKALEKVSLEENCDISSLREILSKRFTADQVNDIIYSHKRYPKWSNQTLMMAYRLRFACGSSGYEQMLKENYPLPSIRTLTRHVEFFKFVPGKIISELIDFLKLKISFANKVHRHCLLVLDEMKITPIVTYDTSTEMMIGKVTLKDKKLSCEDKVTHGLVFMLAGICARWKQIVRYDFTGESIDEFTLRQVIEEIIKIAENNIGLLVHVVTSDMGPANQAVWRTYVIKG